MGAGTAHFRADARTGAQPAFFGAIDPVIVDRLTDPPFSGAVLRAHAEATWLWVCRDLAPDVLGWPARATDSSKLDAQLATVLDRMRQAHALAGQHEHERRLRGQLGGEDALLRLPVLMGALRNRALIGRASDFGRAIEALDDEGARAQALAAIPLQDHETADLMMMATVRAVANPARLVIAALRLSGGGGEAALSRGGFSPLIGAILAHARDQEAVLSRFGVFADADLECKALERFHRLLRAVSGYVELGRLGRWANQVATITASMSELVEPKLRDLPPLIGRALRARPEGADRLDRDALLTALGGVYLLATVKDCRASLAVNAAFDQVWLQVGQMLELLLGRNLEALRQNSGNAVAAARLETGLKMAEAMFGADYADVLRRAKDAAERRTPAPPPVQA